MSIKFNIFVINLDKSTERLTSISKQLSDLGLSFERVSAVNGKSLTAEEKQKIYNEKVNEQKYYKQLNDGEIGCYLSHLACYSKIVEQQLDYALILEDDSKINDDLLLYINHALCLENNWDYIALSSGHRLKKRNKTIALDDKLTLSNAIKLPSTATAQFVSYQGAEKLIKHAYPISRPIDVDIQYWFERDLQCLVAFPLPVTNAGFDSDIESVGTRKHSKKSKLRRYFLKLKFELSLISNKHKLATLPKITKP